MGLLEAQQHLLKSRTEEKATKEAEQRSQSGDECGRSQRQAFSSSPPQSHAREEGHVLRNREASGAQSLKLDSSRTGTSKVFRVRGDDKNHT